MDLALSRDDVKFRDEVRKFLAEAITPDIRRGEALNTGFLSEPDVARPFHQALASKGWSVNYWPKEHGGTGWSAVHAYIFENECARAGAPLFNLVGKGMIGPVIIRFGTDAQKKKYLPRIVSGEDHWCQGYSEPGSGSDLASLKTRAVSDGDDYIVNGQKIWTTYAHKSNRMFALVRTSTAGKRQEGITFLVFDMNLPGITVRPIIGNGGDHEINEVFFDDARIPKSGLIGEENKGWEVAKYLLEFERGGGLQAGRVRAQFGKLVEIVGKRCVDDPDIMHRISTIGTDLDAMEMIDISVLSTLQEGKNPGPISSLLKLRWSQLRQDISELAVDAIGTDALRFVAERPLYQSLQLPPDEEEALAIAPRYLNFRARTIAGGTSEIQTGILARALLGL